MKSAAFILFTVLFTASLSGAQQQQASNQQQQPPEKEKKAAPQPLTPAARLAAAKTAFIKKTGGQDTIPYDVISETLRGWGRFTLVDAPEKADIIVEVFTTEDHPTSVSTTMRPSRRTGGMEPSTSSSKDLTVTQIKVTVYDAKSKMGLWAGTEHPKGALKRVDRENNEVEAAQHLVEKFHDTVEPPGNQ
jgi:hypothetical protein